ncbi:hypothetical protein CkaCkLH20_12777 [Colletotrichum karsti]|uniref:Uncharacterized protein n=1 Tax=Colletotrichum karsti TaxID=1095194 RepID=A0A9P6HT81_9PEZI|nr:uncharacterized protein CkaCkLH20_12777 [Colletotrichum karsti]KAF9869734.1 hypothetical protein CkaCkLH20_12777 [Colletotrichum karsti]
MPHSKNPDPAAKQQRCQPQQPSKPALPSLSGTPPSGPVQHDTILDGGPPYELLAQLPAELLAKFYKAHPLASSDKH